MAEGKHKQIERDVLTKVFAELRRAIPSLGIKDLMDALRLIDGGWPYDSLSDGEGGRSLQSSVRRLWCRRPWTEERVFNQLWERHTARIEAPRPAAPPAPETPPSGKPPEAERAPQPQETRPSAPIESPQARAAVVSAVPIKAPAGLALAAGPTEISAYWPISRRAMAYGWQRLRRPRHDGSETLLDIAATVKDLARRGYLSVPVYARQTRNHAHLALLVDREGSMTPFHPFTRDLVESARDAERQGVLDRVDVFYFHNVTTERLHADPYLTEMVKTKDDPPRLASLDQALAHCNRDTSLLVVSDAGAARGKTEGQFDRIAATQEMIFALSKLTPAIAWLNPMPRPRWRHTAAETIARIVPMFEITRFGFNDAIKAMR